MRCGPAARASPASFEGVGIASTSKGSGTTGDLTRRPYVDSGKGRERILRLDVGEHADVMEGAGDAVARLATLERLTPGTARQHAERLRVPLQVSHAPIEEGQANRLHQTESLDDPEPLARRHYLIVVDPHRDHHGARTHPERLSRLLERVPRCGTRDAEVEASDSWRPAAPGEALDRLGQRLFLLDVDPVYVRVAYERDQRSRFSTLAPQALAGRTHLEEGRNAEADLQQDEGEDQTAHGGEEATAALPFLATALRGRLGHGARDRPYAARSTARSSAGLASSPKVSSACAKSSTSPGAMIKGVKFQYSLDEAAVKEARTACPDARGRCRLRGDSA